MTNGTRRGRWFRSWVGWWDARGAVVRWLLSFGLLVVVLTVVVLGFAAWKLGWGTAFEVLAGYQAPSQACGGSSGSCASHKLAYLVAALGYVFVPAFIGAVAALLVDLGVKRHGPLSATEVEKFRRRIFEDR